MGMVAKIVSKTRNKGSNICCARTVSKDCNNLKPRVQVVTALLVYKVVSRSECRHV